MAAIYRDLAADETRTVQVVGDVLEALGRGRNCLVLTRWKSHPSRPRITMFGTGSSPTNSCASSASSRPEGAFGDQGAALGGEQVDPVGWLPAFRDAVLSND
ncbi:hypothetical protein AD006_30545 (plasmid) [Pseudonocardia sp. EC080610-09]|nr:hypothetical protein [Pseudonocardia sp. EC080610-09]ALL79551.1 hypothetical protein AD006_30545 [Pseudonocardia sp. EC080610-09]ALL85496.1 hypothetical protein AD017_30705 [Pseudonocardia sp. EC080619-01]